MSSQGSGYDLGCHIYSQDGRVFQVEYAEKAVEKGGALIGLRCSDGVVIVAEKLLEHNLLLRRSGRLVHKIDNKSGLAFTGYTQDGRALVPYAQTECSNYKDYFNEDIAPHVLAGRIGEYMHAHTMYGAYRPFGLGVLVTGFDDLDGKAYLHMVNPGGVTYRFFGAAIGKGRQTATTELERLDLNTLTCDKALEVLAEIVLTIREEPRDKAFVLEAGWIKDIDQEFEMVPESIIDAARDAAQKRVDAKNV